MNKDDINSVFSLLADASLWLESKSPDFYRMTRDEVATMIAALELALRDDMARFERDATGGEAMPTETIRFNFTPIPDDAPVIAYPMHCFRCGVKLRGNQCPDCLGTFESIPIDKGLNTFTVDSTFFVSYRGGDE